VTFRIKGARPGKGCPQMEKTPGGGEKLGASAGRKQKGAGDRDKRDYQQNNGKKVLGGSRGAPKGSLVGESLKESKENNGPGRVVAIEGGIVLGK